MSMEFTGLTMFPNILEQQNGFLKTVTVHPVAVIFLGMGQTSLEGCICFIYLFILFYFFISWRLITLQYCSGFCHTLT